jgi:hypothetical protein
MAKSHKELIKFGRAYYSVSVAVTIILILLAYKDVLYLRFGTDFMGEPGTYSSGVQRLLFDGLSGNLLRSFFGNLPLIFFLILLAMITYSVVSTYRRTFEGLNVSKHYVNAKRVPTSTIALTHGAVRSAAFTLPLLYWCLYLIVLFPAIARLPIRYITRANPFPLIASAILTVILLSILTHLGLVLSRLAIRLFKHI